MFHNSYWVVEASYTSLGVTGCCRHFVKEMIGHAFGQSVLPASHRDAKTILSDPIIDVITR
jgi:hypothetical protein